jgi:hypothetical protein
MTKIVETETSVLVFSDAAWDARPEPIATDSLPPGTAIVSVDFPLPSFEEALQMARDGRIVVIHGIGDGGGDKRG